MVKVTVQYVPAGKDETAGAATEVFQCSEELGQPTMPFWPLPLIDGDVVILNMAMIRNCRLEKGRISTPPR